MKRKIFSIVFALVLAVGLSLVPALPAAAAATVTPATGGEGISADTAGGVWTTLSPIQIAEGAAGDFWMEGFDLTIPSGFEFNPASPPDVINVVGDLDAYLFGITATTIRVVTARVSTVASTFYIGSGEHPILVRPTAGTLPAGGNIVMTVGGITGVTIGETNFGTLGMIPGAAHHFGFDAIDSPQTVGAPFGVAITAYDQFGNQAVSYAGTAALSDLSGNIDPTTTAAFTGGVWEGTVTIGAAQLADTIIATDGLITGTSDPFDVIAVSPTEVWVDNDWQTESSPPYAEDTDGDEYFATIQAAINAVDPGGTVHVAVGTYTEWQDNGSGESAGIIINKPLHLQGSGDDCIIRGKTGTTSYMSYSPIVWVKADNVEIDHFKFDGATVTQAEPYGLRSYGINSAWKVGSVDHAATNLNVHHNTFVFIGTAVTQDRAGGGNITVAYNTIVRETRSVWYKPAGATPGSYVDKTLGGGALSLIMSLVEQFMTIPASKPPASAFSCMAVRTSPLGLTM